MQLKEIPSAIKVALQKIKALKTEARSSENKLRSFFESSSVIHLLIDINFEVVDFNRAAVNFIKKYHGIDLHVGLNIMSCVHPDQLKEFTKNFSQAINGIPVRTEKTLIYDKETFTWFLNYEPAWNCEGEIMGMSYNAMDITEKVANEHKIVSQYRSLKEIAYIQSHKLRRPVTSIMGLMGLFKANGYQADREDLLMLEKAVCELHSEMLLIESHTA
ncbi:MAG: PAS domain-containing protein [Bacteroidota bacterium]